MRNQQLRAIYANQREISTERTLLEQVKEFAEIGFNESFRKYIESNKKNIKLFASVTFDTSKYSEKYLEFLNGLILALSLEEKDIKTQMIRDKRALNEHYSRQPKTKDEYPSIEDVEDSTTLNRNVINRLDAFKKEVEALRNQQLILKAKSLVKSAKKDIVENQKNLGTMQDVYLNLLSSLSIESFNTFDLNFERLFGKKAILPFEHNFFTNKRDMNGIIEICKATPVEKKIRGEDTELDEQIRNFELIMRQATDLKNLRVLLQQIKDIEGFVTQKADASLILSDTQKLQELVQFITEQEEKIRRLKQGIKGTSEIHQQTIRAIETIEQSIQKKKAEAESFLKQLSKTSSEVQQKIEGRQVDVPAPSDQVNKEVSLTKKNRLLEAISLIKTYKETLESEQKKFSVKFFHKSRNEGKISYCLSLEKELNSQINTLDRESNLLLIIKNAHDKATKESGAQTEITKGGSYFGTSRMLSLQRLLGIDEAWKTKGHSKFLVFSTQSDFHGLKNSGVVGDKVHKIVKNFYLGVDNSDEPYQEIKKQAFPNVAVNNPQCSNVLN
ncbi:TPA: coiled-coil domain-containing protein [Legionella bozemanae]